MHGKHIVQGQQNERERRHGLQPISGSVYELSSPTSFVKDGRKIKVGDCALFQAGNAPPFIGILRRVSKQKEGSLQVTVNWLYRPADVKLAKGVAVEAAPNEIYYSFHKDEISAASLLHPCKVAFLRKGVELPAGVSSFICRRVYDTNSRCLWNLTDQDYTDEHQEEVNLLLEKTKLEMQAAVQSGGPSPRPLAGSMSSQQQLKSSSENVPNTGFQPGKGKKRERSDEINKRERSSKPEDFDSNPTKRERTTKSEDLASITDKDGGLLDLIGVDKLVMLMQHDQSDNAKKTSDSACRRTSLASIIAATEKDECLKRFVDLGGLPMLDEWLQEAHKGKVGEGGAAEGEKVSDDLLLVLLRALEKLPVDLDALKTCIVGKSVNNLRSHKNQEIQKKSRKLVDTWKKRVDAEMKSGETRPSGAQGLSWSGKQTTDCSPSHLGKGVGSSDMGVKSSGALVGMKTIGNGAGKPNSLVASSALVKENQTKVSSNSTSAELSLKEEKSSCSSQSQSYGSSWSSGPSKGCNTMWKEDVKSPASVSNPKSSAAISRAVGSHGNKGLGQKEAGSNKQMSWNKSNDKISSPDKEGVHFENTSQRLIVRLPNPRRSPARSGGSVVESQEPSGGASPTRLERVTSADGSDIKTRLQNGNTHLENSSDMKNGKSRGLRSEDSRGLPKDVDSGAVVNEQYNNGRTHDSKQSLKILSDAVEVESSLKGEKFALIDDGGMSLLASVAACEDLRCDASCGTGSSRSIITEDGTGEQENTAGSPVKHNDGDAATDSSFDVEHKSTTPSLDKQALDSSCSSPDDETKGDKENSGMILLSTISEEKKNISGEIIAKETSGDTILPDKRQIARTECDGDNATGECLSGFMEDDALEVARQVAKEVEQEVEGYNKPTSPRSPDSVSQGNQESPGRGDDNKSDRKDGDDVGNEENGNGESHSAGNVNSSQDGESKFDDISARQLPDAGSPVRLANAAGSAQEYTRHVDEDELSISLPRNENALSASCSHANLSSVDTASKLVCHAAHVDTREKSFDAVLQDTISNQVAERPVFDLNEGISGEDILDAHSFVPLPMPVCTTALLAVSSTSALTAPIAVVASTNGIIPPTSPLHINKDLGWKGSAATSAFRPAEPRRTPERAPAETVAAEALIKRPKAPLDIDLNVVDEGISEDAVLTSVKPIQTFSVPHKSSVANPPVTNSGPSSSRLDLDLNRVDESEEQSVLVGSELKLPEKSMNPPVNCQVFHDFDLNDGPALEAETLFRDSNSNRNVGKGSSVMSSVHNLRMSREGASMSPWFPVPAVANPAPRAEPSSFPITGGTATHSFLSAGVGGLTSFSGDLYKPAAASSATVTYQAPSSAFPYPGFAFGSSFPFGSTFVGNPPSFVSSTTTPFAGMSSVNPGAMAATLIRPPFLMSIADGIGIENNGTWPRRNLDLNAGPEPAENDAKDEINNCKQPYVMNGQFALEDQMRAFRQVGAPVGALKRKEPDNGWDLYRNAYKPSSWR